MCSRRIASIFLFLSFTHTIALIINHSDLLFPRRRLSGVYLCIPQQKKSLTFPPHITRQWFGGWYTIPHSDAHFSSPDGGWRHTFTRTLRLLNNILIPHEDARGLLDLYIILVYLWATFARRWRNHTHICVEKTRRVWYTKKNAPYRCFGIHKQTQYHIAHW